MRLVKHAAVMSVLSLGLAACGGGGGGGGGNNQTIDPNGTHHTFVLDQVKVPTTPNEADMLALDIDGNGSTENAVGGLLAGLAAQANLDLQGEVDAQVQAGNVIILADLQATDLTNATGVGLRVYLGDTTNVSPAPCTDPNTPSTCGQHLQGTGMFSIAANSPQDAFVVGNNVNGQFTGGPGNLTIELALSGTSAPLELSLIGARAKTSVAADGLTSGLLGGALTLDEVKTKVLPAVAELIAGILSDEGCAQTPPCCPKGSAGESVLGFLNTDNDCDVTEAELEQNSFIQSTLLNPDLDLLDADGKFNPNSDGVKESISLGVGFDAVKGTFTTP